MIFGTNIMALHAHRNLRMTGNIMQISSQRLSSGLRINSAADDAAGYAISERMTVQIRGLRQAEQNIHTGISLMQTLDDAMDCINSILNRKRELVLQSLNDTITQNERMFIQFELDQLSHEINALSSRTEFKALEVFAHEKSGLVIKPYGDGFWIQTGAKDDQGNVFTLHNTSAETLGISDLSVLTYSDANDALAAIDTAISHITKSRAITGAEHNRLGHTLNRVQNSTVILEDARSRIRDTDMAKEMMRFIQAQTLMQSGIALLAHANSNADMVLRLLR